MRTRAVVIVPIFWARSIIARSRAVKSSLETRACAAAPSTIRVISTRVAIFVVRAFNIGHWEEQLFLNTCRTLIYYLLHTRTCIRTHNRATAKTWRSAGLTTVIWWLVAFECFATPGASERSASWTICNRWTIGCCCIEISVVIITINNVQHYKNH